MFKLFGRILNIAGKYKKRIQFAALVSFIEAILGKSSIIFAFVILTKLSEKTLTTSDCLYAGGGLLVVVILQMVTHFLGDKLQGGAGFMIFAEQRQKLGDHLRKLPMGYYTAGNIGKISSILSTDMVFIEEVAMSTLASMLSHIFSAAILTIFMFVLDWRIGMIALIATIIAGFITRRMNFVSAKEAIVRQEQSEHLTDAVLSFTEGISVIKSYNLLGKQSKELSENFNRSKETAVQFERKMTPWTTGLNCLYALGSAAIFGLSIDLYQRGALPLPYVLGLLLFVFDIFGPLKVLFGEATRYTIMDAALNRIEEVMNEAELPDNGTKAISTQLQEVPEISFKNVNFAYEEKQVLHDIHFDVEKNSITALVGPSGGGKSTIGNLLARFWDIQQGSILIRGVDIKKMPLSELMNQLSVVFQRVYLFQDTIYHNIAMGNPDADESDVIEAAKKARCYDFIMALPNGFQTMVGEGGATLSGGEKQRISIARCILKDAPIIILDEATASVDVDNESYIQEAISELVKGKTLLIIAHRLHTIKDAQQILVISEGTITQQGTHEELANEAGIYKDYLNINAREGDWKVI